MFGRRAARETPEEPAAAGETTPRVGPYDVKDAPADDVPRLDLGSVLLPTLPDLEVRMQAGEDGNIGAVIVATPDSAIQVGVFAAPRVEGIWAEVRAEIAGSITSDGGETKEVEGEFGTELLATVPTPEGPSQLRFLGVDGPKWFLRALFQGRAVSEEEAAEPLMETLRHLVVVRDGEARPVREPLPLRLPKQMMDEAAARQRTGGDEDPGQPASPAPGA